METKTKQYLVAGGILVGALALAGGVYYFGFKKPITTGTDPAAVKGWDAKIQVLNNKQQTFSSTERLRRLNEKFTPAEVVQVLYLMKQWDIHRATMTETEKEKLAKMMNLAFGY